MHSVALSVGVFCTSAGVVYPRLHKAYFPFINEFVDLNLSAKVAQPTQRLFSEMRKFIACEQPLCNFQYYEYI